MVDGWLVWLGAAQASPDSVKTRRAQANAVRRHHDLLTVTEEQLLQLLAASSWSRATKHAYRSGWRSLFGWMMAKGHRPDNPAAGLPVIRVPQSVPKPTSQERIEFALIAGSERDRLMVLLGGYEGLRRAEIARLRLEDVEPYGLRITGKGGKVRVVPIHPRVDGPLREWIAKQPGPWVFPSPIDITRHISTSYVGVHLKDATGEVGHHLRHRFGTAVQSATHDLRITQELMGHASPATTAIYTLVQTDAKTAAVQAIA